MAFSPLIEQMIDAFQCLPGVGRKTAQRMTLQLLERDREGAAQLSAILAAAVDRVIRCSLCRNLSELEVCPICADAGRERSRMCIVETPADVLAVEQAGGYRGLYFVLMGHLSPIDGIGPREIGIDRLVERAAEERFEEVILATNPTVEGDATAFYISEQLHKLEITVSRIAHGVPVGGELEYVDGGTLQHAFNGRKVV